MPTLEEHFQNDPQQAILLKIADGKLLLRFSYMDHNVTCDCCQSEEKIVYQEQPDKLKHKEWCLVTAVRALFPDFLPSNYPAKLSDIRGWLEKDCDKPHLAWTEKPVGGPPAMTQPTRSKKSHASLQPMPEERDLADIIKVLKANIASPGVLLNPDTCFTKGQMAYIIEILEQHQRGSNTDRANEFPGAQHSREHPAID